jgi:hypothetical protein
MRTEVGSVSQHLDGAFEVTSWSEDQAPRLDGTRKVATARIGQRFTGGVDAETIADMVMTYAEDGTAEFVGYQRVQGRVAGRSGTFVLRGIGRYDGAEARTELDVVPGSGTGELAGIRGRGLASAPHGSTGTYSLDLDV